VIDIDRDAKRVNERRRIGNLAEWEIKRRARRELYTNFVVYNLIGDDKYRLVPMYRK
jgi:hypothetical protein